MFTIEDPGAEDVTALLAAHLDFSRETSPAGHVHALEVDHLLDPAVTFFTARRDHVLLGMGATRELEPTRAELKSMHRCYSWLGLETGSMEAFAPARRRYRSVGFTVCSGSTSRRHLDGGVLLQEFPYDSFGVATSTGI